MAQFLDELGIPTPWDLTEFCRRWDRQRGRTTRLIPTPALDEKISGLTLSSGNTDYIWYVQTTGLHRDHIVMHEIGHHVLGHSPRYQADPALLARLLGSTLTHVSPKTTKLMLCARTVFDSIDETEAELFATVVLAQTKAVPPPAPNDALHHLRATWGQG
ncbi:hypothetical protein ABZ801_01305 [Actinomadura sp. NPDC047616]|uniref:hypothetical protein n=1 Tax=Actinomadura sp. NPDC047616 TaxID=3155914 RepID=UPI0033C1D97A